MKNKKTSKIACERCGLCCRLFVINLNEKEYLSGRYATTFENAETFANFDLAEKVGANFLKQTEDGSCIYLKDNGCSIHHSRPAVCRKFFCQGTEKRYEGMREIIAATRAKSA